MWDRSKQTYWINRLSLSVIRISDHQKVCDFPKHVSVYDTVLVEKICFAEDDESVIGILKDVNNVNSTRSL